MKLTKRMVFMGLSVILIAQSAWAVRVKNAGQPASQSTSATIERGGMVTAIDPSKKTISVDGVSYPLAPGVQDSAAQLKQGSLIRFTTAKNNAKSADRVTEISVATPPPAPRVKR